jgi:hypothetical protein
VLAGRDGKAEPWEMPDGGELFQPRYPFGAEGHSQTYRQGVARLWRLYVSLGVARLRCLRERVLWPACARLRGRNNPKQRHVAEK